MFYFAAALFLNSLISDNEPNRKEQERIQVSSPAHLLPDSPFLFCGHAVCLPSVSLPCQMPHSCQSLFGMQSPRHQQRRKISARNCSINSLCRFPSFCLCACKLKPAVAGRSAIAKSRSPSFPFAAAMNECLSGERRKRRAPEVCFIKETRA